MTEEKVFSPTDRNALMKALGLLGAILTVGGVPAFVVHSRERETYNVRETPITLLGRYQGFLVDIDNDGRIDGIRSEGRYTHLAEEFNNHPVGKQFFSQDYTKPMSEDLRNATTKLDKAQTEFNKRMNYQKQMNK